MESRRRIIVLPFFLLLLAFAGQAATDPWVGTWVRKSITGLPADKVEFTMTVESLGTAGYRLTYRLSGVPGVTTVDTAADGTDAPVLINGKTTGETMAIQRLDDHHLSTVLKMNGKQIGISKGALSADGNTITAEGEITGSEGGVPGKQTEIWIRK